jgi:hypothetical protein
MQFLSLLATAAALSLGITGSNRHLRLNAWQGPPACVDACDDACSPDCDKTSCSPDDAAMINGHCAGHYGGGPPDCVADCQAPCTPDCDKSNCSVHDMAIIDDHCSDTTNDTVITEPHPNQVEINVAQKIKDNMDGMDEDCSNVDCSPLVVENCAKLWEDKFEVCIEKAEEWAYICPAPTYEGHNCGWGCCSEVAQDDCAAMEMPPMEEVWEFMSAGTDEITRDGLEAGLVALLPPVVGDHVPALTDCMMIAYDTGGDGKIDRAEFESGYGEHLPTCMENNLPVEVLAEVTSCGESLQDIWDFLSGADDGDTSSVTAADMAAFIGMHEPTLAPHAMPLATCIIDFVDGIEGDAKDGQIQFEEFEAAAEQDLDPFGPCLQQHVPADALAPVAANGDEHWCTYTDPEEEPCCKLQDHDEQDKCMEDKGIAVLRQKARKTHLRIRKKKAHGFARFLNFGRQKKVDSKKSPKVNSKTVGSKKAPVKTSRKLGLKLLKHKKGIKPNSRFVHLKVDSKKSWKVDSKKLWKVDSKKSPKVPQPVNSKTVDSKKAPVKTSRKLGLKHKKDIKPNSRFVHL